MSGPLSHFGLMSARSAGGGGGVAVAHRYWRLFRASAASYTSIQELEFRTVASPSTGITETATGGAAFASSFYAPENLVPANAFNGTFGGARYASDPGSNWHIGYDFGAGNEKAVVQVAISGDGIGGSQNLSGSVLLQFSDDGSSWVTLRPLNVSGLTAGAFNLYATPHSEDPYFGAVALLLNFEGEAGTPGTVGNLLDESFNAFVASSAGFNYATGGGGTDWSSTNNIVFPSSPAFAQPGDFTAECIIRAPSWPSYGAILNIGAYNSGLLWRINGASTLDIWMNASNLPASVPGGLLTNDELHLALSRVGGLAKSFVQGVEVGSTNQPTAIGAAAIRLAASQHNTSESLASSILRKFRLTSGVGRYASAFTPPTDFPGAGS